MGRAPPAQAASTMRRTAMRPLASASASSMPAGTTTAPTVIALPDERLGGSSSSSRFHSGGAAQAHGERCALGSREVGSSMPPGSAPGASASAGSWAPSARAAWSRRSVGIDAPAGPVGVCVVIRPAAGAVRRPRRRAAPASGRRIPPHRPGMASSASRYGMPALLPGPLAGGCRRMAGSRQAAGSRWDAWAACAGPAPRTSWWPARRAAPRSRDAARWRWSQRQRRGESRKTPQMMPYTEAARLRSSGTPSTRKRSSPRQPSTRAKPRNMATGTLAAASGQPTPPSSQYSQPPPTASPEHGQDDGHRSEADAPVVPDAQGQVEEHADQERLRRGEEQLGGHDVERPGDRFTDLHLLRIGAKGGSVRQSRLPMARHSCHHHARRGHPRRRPRHRHRGPRRSRQDHARGRHAPPVRRLPRRPGGHGPGHGLHGPRARARHHHPRQADRHHLQGRAPQHRGHARPCRLRRRGRAQPAHGRLGPAARGRRRGAAAADPLRPLQGHGPAPAGHRGHQQDRPRRRAARGRPGRRLRALHGPRRDRPPDRVPHRLHQRPHGHGQPRPRRARPGPAAAHGPARGAHAAAAPRARPPAAAARHQPRRPTTTWAAWPSAASATAVCAWASASRSCARRPRRRTATSSPAASSPSAAP